MGRLMKRVFHCSCGKTFYACKSKLEMCATCTKERNRQAAREWNRIHRQSHASRSQAVTKSMFPKVESHHSELMHLHESKWERRLGSILKGEHFLARVVT
jgi:hypothetical protein